MILLEVKKYIEQHHQVSADNLRHKFNLSPDALEGIMQPLIDQGMIQMVDAEGQCNSGNCHSSCQINSEHSFFWLGRRIKNISIPITTRT